MSRPNTSGSVVLGASAYGSLSVPRASSGTNTAKRGSAKSTASGSVRQRSRDASPRVASISPGLRASSSHSHNTGRGRSPQPSLGAGKRTPAASPGQPSLRAGDASPILPSLASTRRGSNGTSQNKLKKPFIMTQGDHFVLAKDADFVRVAFGWDHRTSDMTDVDASAIVHAANGEKTDHVSFGRRVAKDRCLVHLGDDKGRDVEGDDESIDVHFSRLPKDVSAITFMLCVYTTGKSLADVNGVFFRLIDKQKNELCRYKLDVSLGNATATVMLVMRRMQWTWRVVALATPFNARTHRQLTSDAETLVARCLQGWLPKANYRSAGDRKNLDKMYDNLLASHGVLVSSSDQSGGANSQLVETDSLGSHSPAPSDNTIGSESSGSDSDVPLSIGPPTSPPKRVIREGRRAYNIGFSAHRRTGEESDEEDLDVFSAILPQYSSRTVVRYDGGCYNVGSKRQALVTHLNDNRREYTEALQDREPTPVINVDDSRDAVHAVPDGLALSVLEKSRAVTPSKQDKNAERIANMLAGSGRDKQASSTVRGRKGFDEEWDELNPRQDPVTPPLVPKPPPKPGAGKSRSAVSARRPPQPPVVKAPAKRPQTQEAQKKPRGTAASELGKWIDVLLNSQNTLSSSIRGSGSVRGASASTVLQPRPATGRPSVSGPKPRSNIVASSAFASLL